MDIPLRRKNIKTKPWSWAMEEPDTVNFLSTGLFECFGELEHKVWIMHGVPIYCLHIEMFERKNALLTTWSMAKECDHAVCWSKQSAEYWRTLVPNVEYVERGVDLDFWKPEGDKFERRFHPQVTMLEIGRIIKLPFTYLFALKYARERKSMRNLRANVGCIDVKFQLLWFSILTKLDLEPYVQDFIIGVHPEPWKYFRSSDMVVSPVQGGLMSRVAVEALACGSPVIMLEGCKEKKATVKCMDDPLSMADAMEKVWGMMENNPEGTRKKARRLAEKHYDVKDTAHKFLKIAEKLV